MNKPPKIVVLDGFTLNPGDLDWDSLHALGDVEIYDRTAPEDVISRASGAEIILTNKVILDREKIENLPDLRYIGVMATGYNVVDFVAANERGIIVTNVPEYATKAVVQMVFALLFELTQHVGHHSGTVFEGHWASNKDFCYWDMPLVEVDNLTFGIIGYGRIGQAVANVALAFGMNVLANNRNPVKNAGTGIRFVDLDTLFAKSDIVSLHCPLTVDTKEIICASRLSQMKDSAYLINTGRGPLLNEKDVADALNSGQIAGAGLDVLSVEPPSPDNPLLKAKNCVITPHIAWATRAARSRLMATVVENVRLFCEGTPQNIVEA